MGAIARALANSITTGGVVQASAINNTSVSSVTALPSGVDTGDLVLISSQTASASASIEFTSGLDSTYDEYIFKFINIHPGTDNADLSFQGSTDSGSNYNVTITSSFFAAYNNETGSSYDVAYDTNRDLAQSTSFQRLSQNTGNANDDNTIGTLKIFNPSSTTYVKHFIARTSAADGTYEVDSCVAGYFNTTSAINAIQFKMNTGNIDDGTISLYGVKKS